ncbi:pilus assembly protein [Microbulbifer hydrolyticus]|uniref:Type IV pilus assembly protein PilY1 n=1 Tax=Microbulbifer hydrolyticus TaxID=48074 RepID=A0AA89PTL4_9GAMM|nr:PilC/PilY family type IV pilus protein [Microbulbifer hydrolyticus]MBB5210912.1 type IV pilus assembly protein PilY1 [Microbulbifer hydrolyticus]
MKVENGNYNTNNWLSCTENNATSVTCTASADSETFWPARYYWHDGGSEWDRDNYTKTDIRSGSDYSGHDRSKRSDCDNGICTYAQEIQNFANWYTYYRSRTLAARAGIGRAFAEQGEDIRVGFGAINKGDADVDGINARTIVSGVRDFSGTSRESFFSELYTRGVSTSGTPLRRALDDAGQYFSRTDNKGPWGADPGVEDTTAHLACRASYTILMTDGYWSDGQASTADARANVDNATGTQITGPDGQSYTYSAVSPFTDAHSNTLADVAMYYWKNDLRTDLVNQVPVKDDNINPAFWQHMVTFGVGLGVTGSIDKEAAFDAINDSGITIAWPDPSNSNSAKVDDLLHAAVNSRGGFFSAADPQKFSSELSNVLENILGRSDGAASSVATNSTRLGTDTVVYQALFNSTDWSGELKAVNLNSDGTVGTEKWSTDTASFASAATRDIYTHNGSSGVPFAWGATAADGISDAQKADLTGADTAVEGANRLLWVRGAEVAGLRDRQSLLGDIVNSSPVFAGRKKQNFHLLSDALGGHKYTDYYNTSKKNRREVLYVNANDGMLHAFDAATGEELFAYVPAGVYEKLRKLSATDYGESSNSHTYIVDGPLFVGDAYINGSWKNVLVGTLGAGGKGIFALDVTNPDSFDENDVLFDFTDEDLYSGDLAKLGNITNEPIIGPTNSGWRLFFGNGYNSTGGNAHLFAVSLDNPIGGTKVISAGSASENGLSGPALLPSGTGEVVSAYAGDLLGNLWAFDISAGSSDNWDVAYSTADVPEPLFTAVDPNNKVQPITSIPTLGLNSEMNNAVMVYFGTGSYLSSTDNSAGDTINSFYAIADTGTNLTGRGQLFAKTISSETDGRRVVDGNAATAWWTDKKGWYLDFTFNSSVTGERIISKPLLIYDRLLFPTLITSSDPCAFGGSGWLMELVAVGNKYQGHSIFGEDGEEVDYAVIGYSGTVQDGDKILLPTNNIKGELNVPEGDAPVDATGRMSWRQLR